MKSKYPYPENQVFIPTPNPLVDTSKEDLLSFSDMPDGLNADQMDGFRQASIMANERVKACKERWQLESQLATLNKRKDT